MLNRSGDLQAFQLLQSYHVFVHFRQRTLSLVSGLEYLSKGAHYGMHLLVLLVTSAKLVQCLFRFTVRSKFAPHTFRFIMR